VNNVHVGELPGTSSANKTVVFIDAVPIQLGGGCFHPNPNTSRVVHCITPASNTLARIALEDESDRLQPAAVDAPASIRFSSEGGSGNDAMIGTVNGDVLDGVSGHDNISGRDGNDDLNGGLGRDWLDGGGGNDNLDAGDDASGDHADCGESPFDNDLGLINQGDLVTNGERLVFVS
jgi:RTX calcium-binding nonapeptide repeat (4 copies)